MSEFKFACPVCGQHITADSANTGSQLECPTCYRKIVVPQAPASTDPKFILSAAEANKPRPPQPTVPKLEPIGAKPAGSMVPLIIGVAVLLTAGTVLAVFHDKIFKKSNSPESKSVVAQNAETNDEDQAAAKKTASVPAPTNDIAWNMELGAVEIPDGAVAGKLRGEFVACNRATLTGGSLGFRQMTKGLPDLSVTIAFFSKQPEELRGKSFNIDTNDSPAPRVTIRWREGKETQSLAFTGGYALKVELGDIANNRIAGKIYLSLPDESQSRVAGTFIAEVKKPAQPKPKAPKPKPGS